MNQTLLLIAAWTLLCVQTAWCRDGCGILAGHRRVSVSTNRAYAGIAESASINCTASRKNENVQTLEFLLDTRSLVNFSSISLTNNTKVHVHVDVHLAFSQPVKINTTDFEQSFHTTNGTGDREGREHELTGRLSGRREIFTVRAQGKGNTFEIQNASVQVRIESVLNYEDNTTTTLAATTKSVTSSPGSGPVLPVCQDSSISTSEIVYIVGLAVTSTIAIVCVVICVLLCRKLQRSRTHHYVEPLPIDFQAIRPPAKTPARSQSEPELLGATARFSAAYDYAFVDGPPVTVSPRRNSDLDIPKGMASTQKSIDVIIKRPLQKTRSISEPILHPPGAGSHSKESKPKPPPKPKVSPMRKVLSEDQMSDSAVYDDPHSPTRHSPVDMSRKHTKPIPSPRLKRKVIPKKGATTRSTTSDGYLRPADTQFRQKSIGGEISANGTTQHHAVVDVEEGLYVPMDVEKPIGDEDCYIPMGSLGSCPSNDRSPSEDPQQPAVPQQSAVSKQPAVKHRYQNVEEWLDNTAES